MRFEQTNNRFTHAVVSLYDVVRSLASLRACGPFVPQPQTRPALSAQVMFARTHARKLARKHAGMHTYELRTSTHIFLCRVSMEVEGNFACRETVHNEGYNAFHPCQYKASALDRGLFVMIRSTARLDATRLVHVRPPNKVSPRRVPWRPVLRDPLAPPSGRGLSARR